MFYALFQRSTADSKKVNSDNADYLRVIGAGLPRTGTSSLKVALEILGFGPCHHMSELYKNPDRSVQFIRAYDGYKVDFHALMKGYGSTTDTPTMDFYKEIHAAYPEAKIVLTVRDNGEKWFDSFDNTIRTICTDNDHYIAIYLIGFLRKHCSVARKMWQKWTAEYGQIGPWVHDQHKARVINENKEGQVLVFNVKEGWPPLCKFLGVDIPPGIPFPNINDSQNIKRQIALSRTMGWCVWTFVGIVIAVTVYVLIRITM